MKKNITVIILVILLTTALFFAYSYFTKFKGIQRDFLIAYCNNLSERKVNIENISVVLEDFYIEELPQKDSQNERLFGLSKSRFDTFCVVTYDQNGNVTKSGLSYD